MPDKPFNISLSINRRSDGARIDCELNSTSLGFGIFQLWLFLAVFCFDSTFLTNPSVESMRSIAGSFSNNVIFSFLASCGITLLVIGLTDQRGLRFYVSRNACLLAAGLCSAGTLILFACHIETMGFAASLTGGILMGVGGALFLTVWGTTFSRFNFSTIVLNTAIASTVGIIAAVCCSTWIPAPFSGIVALLLPALSLPILNKLIPTPFYLQDRDPIFKPLEVRKAAFYIRFGIPVFLFAIPLGLLRGLCIGHIIPSEDISYQFVLAFACIISVLVFIVTILFTKRDMYWDTLFRMIMPITVLSLVALPILTTGYSLVGTFAVCLGFVCLEVLLWVFFAGISQEFGLSPIFVFGIGNGLLELGSILGIAFGSNAALSLADNSIDYSTLALIAVLISSLAYALLPRYREIAALVVSESAFSERNATASIGKKGVDDDELLIKTELSPAKSTLEDDVFDSSSANSSGAPEAAPDDEAELINEASAVNLDPASPEDMESAHAHEGSFNASLPRRERMQENQGKDTDLPATQDKGRFYMRCEAIARKYLLSKRETEVFVLLAKGHNASFIQNDLCVSKSTAKTHINHIYKKLDIHTQQELLNIVDEMRKANTLDAEEKSPDKSDLEREREYYRKAAAEYTQLASSNHPEKKLPRSNSYRRDIFK